MSHNDACLLPAPRRTPRSKGKLIIEFDRPPYQVSYLVRRTSNPSRRRNRGMPILHSLVKACLVLAMLAVAPALAGEGGRPDKVSFYFAAHEDDWQLFMNPSAFEDVASGTAKTVFVHVTAGDAGLGMGWGGRKQPYYLARENGAETAIRFMADANDIPADKTASHLPFNGHSVYRVSYRNTVSYFLRVPDGSMSGTGYYETGFESLKRLADGEKDVLSAIDGSTVYHGWNDLVATLRAILEYERGRAAIMQINVAELDPGINPNDHPDHLMTARAALDAANGLPCVRRVHYVDYASSRLPENLELATAGHGKLGIRGDARRRSGARSPRCMASLRSVLCRPELFPR